VSKAIQRLKANNSCLLTAEREKKKKKTDMVNPSQIHKKKKNKKPRTTKNK
jgi:hypothetical protein